MTLNIAQVVLFLGTSFLTVAYEMNPLVWWVVVAVCIFTWQTPAVTDEVKEYYKQQARLYKLQGDKLEKGLVKK